MHRMTCGPAFTQRSRWWPSTSSAEQPSRASSGKPRGAASEAFIETTVRAGDDDG